MALIDQLTANSASIPKQQGRPLVTLSFAQSLDGCLTARKGSPTRLSGMETQVLTHQLRAVHDSILVGIGTILIDNPRLTVRLVEGRNPQPVILDSHLRFPLDASLLDGSCQPWIITTPAASPANRVALEGAGARVLVLPADEMGRVDLSAALKCLYESGIASMMVEGGAQVITSFLAARLVDQIVITIAPLFLGGVHAVENGDVILKNRSPAQIATPGQGSPIFPRLTRWDWERMGNDLVVWGAPDWGPEWGAPGWGS